MKHRKLNTFQPNTAIRDAIKNAAFKSSMMDIAVYGKVTKLTSWVVNSKSKPFKRK